MFFKIKRRLPPSKTISCESPFVFLFSIFPPASYETTTIFPGGYFTKKSQSKLFRKEFAWIGFLDSGSIF
ncbi:MAG: hypothetical protein A2407_04460 [Candidatus Moranbacteria bacterium RIFOXYC1_FULL_44_8]|nr:MAG: hypothetical protein A2407_04460 [Candidatus Moranbacteria bacterium RIFOXYC1_FULL_44_8]